MDEQHRSPPILRTGRSELPTTIEPVEDPRSLQLRVRQHTSQIDRLSAAQGELLERQRGQGDRLAQVERLAPKVDALAVRQAADAQTYASRDLVWALEKRLEAIEKRDRTREWIALAVLVAMVAWTGLLTLVFVLAVGAR